MGFQKLERLSNHLKAMARDAKKIVRLQQKESDLTFENSTQKARDRVRNDLNWAFMEFDKDTHEAHALAVEFGIASIRKPEAYEQIEYNPSGWHKYNYTPRKPFTGRRAA